MLCTRKGKTKISREGGINPSLGLSPLPPPHPTLECQKNLSIPKEKILCIPELNWFDFWDPTHAVFSLTWPSFLFLFILNFSIYLFENNHV